MTNDKDSAMRMASFLADIENSTLEELRQRCSSQMDRINDQASEINRLRQPTQSDGLREALEGVLPYVLTNYFRCNGDKCRHPTCASCCGEDFAESQSDKANLALTKAKAALAALQEQSK
jgi:hypothetical protein